MCRMNYPPEKKDSDFSDIYKTIGFTPSTSSENNDMQCITPTKSDQKESLSSTNKKLLLEPSEKETKTLSANPKMRQRHCCRTYLLVGFLIVGFGIISFLSLFVIYPLVFMNMNEMQTNLVFQRWRDNEDKQFSNFKRHGIKGGRNIYVRITNATQPFYLGTWHILHLSFVYKSEKNTFSYENALYGSNYPVVLYFHDTFGNRITYTKQYLGLRKFFHVIAFDYRGYGDSNNEAPTEDAVVKDCVQMYKWLMGQTKAPIYIWGVSLGASLATHTVAKLLEETVVPMGLFLESPYTSLREQLQYFPQAKMFSWLPWFNKTMVRSCEDKGLVFNTIEYIKMVNCPIKILHAKDDSVVPISLAKKLFKEARKLRNGTTQGSITFHELNRFSGFGHLKLYEASSLSRFILSHIKNCEKFDKKRI